MKVLVSTSMSNTKNRAEDVLTAHVPQIVDNVVKIFLCGRDLQTVQEWTDEIADKHLSVLRRVVNNVKTKKGRLSKETISKVWLEQLSDNLAASLRATRRSPSYLHLVQSKSLLEVSAFEEALKKYAPEFARKLLVNTLETDDAIAEDLSKISVPNQQP